MRSGRKLSPSTGAHFLVSFSIFALLSILTACGPGPEPRPGVRPYPCQPAGFTTPEPGMWVEVAALLREYFYFRKQAILKQDISLLWERYPALREPYLPTRGINAERLEVDHTRPYLDGNIAFDRDFRVRLRGDTLQVYVHGWEEYLLPDFSITGSEFYIQLDFQRRGFRWELTRTDALTEAELHQCMQGGP